MTQLQSFQSLNQVQLLLLLQLQVFNFAEVTFYQIQLLLLHNFNLIPGLLIFS